MAPYQSRELGLIDRYKRWRHGHGFGVHSPYAYHMVREVLRPPRSYGYYAYSALQSAELRLLYRILVELRPATVCVCAEGVRRRALEQLVALALPSARVGRDGDMLIVDRQAAVGNTDVKFAYFNNPAHPALERIIGAMTRGHVYRNPSRALAVCTPRLPMQVFEVKF